MDAPRDPPIRRRPGEGRRGPRMTAPIGKRTRRPGRSSLSRPGYLRTCCPGPRRHRPPGRWAAAIRNRSRLARPHCPARARPARTAPPAFPSARRRAILPRRGPTAPRPFPCQGPTPCPCHPQGRPTPPKLRLQPPAPARHRPRAGRPVPALTGPGRDRMTGWPGPKVHRHRPSAVFPSVGRIGPGAMRHPGASAGAPASRTGMVHWPGKKVRAPEGMRRPSEPPIRNGATRIRPRCRQGVRRGLARRWPDPCPTS